MPRVVATIISDNRQELIGQAIQSAAEWVDEVVLIDTGITDNTRDVARSLLGERLIVETFAWQNDFAAARNFALQAATRRGATWALTLDTDERLHFSGFASQEELIARLDSNPKLRAWLALSQDGSYCKERFIYAGSERPRLTWMGRTHEYLAGARDGERDVLAGVTVSETRKAPERLRAKLLRDLAILEEETRTTPEAIRWWYYLGQTYEGLGRFADAADAYRRCAAARNAWSEQSAWACYRAANCCLRIGQPEEALELCTLGLARQPESPELAWLAGYVCYRLRRFRQAITWSQISIALGNFRGHQAGQRRISFRFLPAWYESPYDVLRFAHRELRQPDLAAQSERDFAEAKKQRLAASGTVAGPADPSRAGVTSGDGPRRDDSGSEDRKGAGPQRTHAEGAGCRAVRVAVMGLYSSGSTATAAMLHHLGVTLGRDVTAEYHYEPRWLAAQLRSWWSEPGLVEAMPRPQRVRMLSEWLADMERRGSPCVGAKHPLLTLCGPDLLEAWGPGTKFIWTWRPLEESIASLKHRGWWPGKEEAILRRLWDSANDFFGTQPHLRVSFKDVLGNPAREVERLIDFLELPVSASQRAAAAAVVQRRQPLGPGRKVLFDLGAHYGEGLRKLQGMIPLNEQWEIHAYEPNPNCDTAQHLAGLQMKAAIHREAVWIRDGRVAFCAQDRKKVLSPQVLSGPSDLDGWGSGIADIGSRVHGLTQTMEVPCVDFSRLLAERPETDEIIVKMDVEGAEFSILRRLVELGTIRRIRRLYVEWHDRLLESENALTREELERQIRDAGVEVVPWT